MISDDRAVIAIPPVTLNFHPDTKAGTLHTIVAMARDGLYRSQFETGTSNGGLSPHRGGSRWSWESRMFDGVYDDADDAVRPKYGALNRHLDPVGAARRFGSCHLRLKAHVLDRTTFCYPESHFEPDGIAADPMPLLRLCAENALRLEPLDNYVEAHVHGLLTIQRDVEAVVLDPSYADTFVEESARSLGCTVEWHAGFRLSARRHTECAAYRNAAAADAVVAVAEDGTLTPRTLGLARDRLLDRQLAKWVWHCLARFGGPA